MPREVISLHVGQGGNQIGLEYWRLLAAEHGIAPDGNLLLDDEAASAAAGWNDRRDAFFQHVDQGRYQPRALLLDLEPGVHQKVRQSSHGQLFAQDSFLCPGEGGGAGNVFPRGHRLAGEYLDDVEELLGRQADLCDSLEAFQLTHSVAGGTGSGMGARMLETISDWYPKKTLLTWSVLPSFEEPDLVTQPYNMSLCLRTLFDHADCIGVLDNTALQSLRRSQESRGDPQGNLLSARVAAAASAPVRFPSYTHTSLTSITASLCPVPQMNMVISSHSPVDPSSTSTGSSAAHLCPLTTLKSLFRGKTSLAAVGRKEGKYISAFQVITSPLPGPTISAALHSLHEGRIAPFIGWGPAGVQLAHVQRAPVALRAGAPAAVGGTGAATASTSSPTGPRIQGTMLANHTSVATLLERALEQLEPMRRKNAFFDQFAQEPMFNDGVEALDEAENAMQSAIEEYRQAKGDDYLS